VDISVPPDEPYVNKHCHDKLDYLNKQFVAFFQSIFSKQYSKMAEKQTEI
jgi:hypothetical protein